MLTPAYDMLSTALVMLEDTEELALTLNDKKRKIKKADGSPKYTLAQRMSVSGHKTESQYVNYIKCSLDEYAEMVAAANEIDGDNLF